MTFLPRGTFPVIFMYICGVFSFKNKLFFQTNTTTHLYAIVLPDGIRDDVLSNLVLI